MLIKMHILSFSATNTHLINFVKIYVFNCKKTQLKDIKQSQIVLLKEFLNRSSIVFVIYCLIVGNTLLTTAVFMAKNGKPF